MGEFEEDWELITQEDRAVQQAAADNPECFDDETRELMTLVQEERIKRAA